MTQYILVDKNNIPQKNTIINSGGTYKNIKFGNKSSVETYIKNGFYPLVQATNSQDKEKIQDGLDYVFDVDKKQVVATPIFRDKNKDELLADRENLIAQKLEQIKNDFIKTISSDATTSTGRTWKANAISGLSGTAAMMRDKREMTLIANSRAKSITFYESGKTTPTTLKIDGTRKPDELQREAIEIAIIVERAYATKNTRKKALNELAIDATDSDIEAV